MCNNYEQRIVWATFRQTMQDHHLALPEHQSAHDLPRADDIKINDLAPIVRAAGDGVEITQMRFGLPPSNPRGGPVFNFRSDGRHFGDSNRCLIPASAFFEFTGKKYPKAKHRFTLEGGPFMAIAGLWRAGVGNQPGGFAMLTTEPGTDVAPYHNRQIVVLAPADWKAWIYLSKRESELLRPLPAGTLKVETVQKGSD